MRHLSLATLPLALLACNLADAQVKGNGHARTEARPVTGFTSVSAGGAVDLTITLGSPAAVTVTADDNVVPIIRTRVKGTRLIIDSTDSYSPRTPVQVAITLPSLVALELSGATTAVAHGLTGDSLTLGLSGATHASLDGKVGAVTIEADGAADLDAAGLTSGDATVATSGASDVELHVDRALTASASGASSIRYLGTPSVTKDVSGAASIRSK